MTRLSATIAKQPPLPPEQDFYRLRREGIGFIEQMASRLWTDYNESDSGIAIHEALCYAITDLGYRTGWDIRDLLAPVAPSGDPKHPFPNQPFFTARSILTVNPWTESDFRRLLIDLEPVRNAWIVCKECACDTAYYAWCGDEGLALSYQAPELVERTPLRVWPLGLYEALLELEEDPDAGDLNDRKIESVASVADAEGSHSLIIELRFEEVSLADRDQWQLFLESDDAFAGRNGASIDLKLIRLGATRSYDLLTDPTLDEEGRNDYLRGHWRTIFYATFEIGLTPSGKKIVLHAALRLLGNAATRDALTVATLKAMLEERSVNGLIQRYRRKERLKDAAVASAKQALMAHRNLDEDYCRVQVVGIEEVAACADVEVAPDADIELVQARIWFEIERYFNPPVPFYTLRELMDQGMPVEEIFNGPELDSGFLRQEELDAAELRSVLCVSDLINRLMDIEGIIAVNQLQLTRYDSEGNAAKGVYDPLFSSDGKPIFDPGKASGNWLVYLSEQHLPRLYRNASRFLFYKNGLPFLPRMDEALDTLTLLRGEAERLKNPGRGDDLDIPKGEYRDPEAYFPVQYSFPLTYGIGPDQLSTTASARRRAQARQMKAYLMVFEQILADAFAQLAHTADLFSLDPAVSRTYFAAELDEATIQGYSELVNGLTRPVLEGMLETAQEFRLRRNRFLDHLLARFGEDFSEYGLLLAKVLGQEIALDQLIKDKIAFLADYPRISHDRGKGFDYQHDPCNPDNQAGIRRRIALLLGYPELDRRMIVVEHLLLRPKFPGDALYPACTEGACSTCGAEDPYSFRLTLVMPGWLDPFHTDLEMRGYADRVIRQEVPAHLVAKICWVGNDGYVEDPCDPVLARLATLLERSGHKADGLAPSADEACACAILIYREFSQVFKGWYQDKFLDHFHTDALKMELELLFDAKVTPEQIACVVLPFELWSQVLASMVEHFGHIARYGWQYQRFQKAWCEWLELNATFDWMDERLEERVEAILTRNLMSAKEARTGTGFRLCNCARALLTAFGVEFYQWLDGLFRSGSFSPDIALPTFPIELPPACAGLTFQAGTLDQVRALLEERYHAYSEVSYRLRVVLDLLGALSNSYPPATLHDCDEGNDKNPVRLGTTALGS
ncbi:hypothetical protein KP003_07465 [Geomonas nitrogeniifigens]|uniref:hypothetical protein n=1 Tax=Geomonas diazotrophica TaxID=2843197 RepID=UPI001C2B7A10|nr:hypothetical protein [Geomonas nitrogeniifigens]QXE88232.1 hypothetical protein KP003_07465 [Geomonas nitrogeniifigens]